MNRMYETTQTQTRFAEYLWLVVPVGLVIFLLWIS